MMSIVCVLSIDDGVVVRVEYLVCVIGGIFRCQEDICSVVFEGLVSVCYGYCVGVLFGVFGLFSGEGSGDEGGLDWVWCYFIDVNFFFDELQSEFFCECQYCVFCCGVVEEYWSVLVGCD